MQDNHKGCPACLFLSHKHSHGGAKMNIHEKYLSNNRLSAAFDFQYHQYSVFNEYICRQLNEITFNN